MRKHEPYEDDDGRTIADMSGVSAPGLFGNRVPDTDNPQDGGPRRRPSPWEESSLDAGQRFWAVLGALSAALLIGLVFLAGLGLIILLMVLFW